jgi:hypothetical protein
MHQAGLAVSRSGISLARASGICGRCARYRQRGGWDAPKFPCVEGRMGVVDRDEHALLWAGSHVGTVVSPDERMHLVAIGEEVVADSIGDPVDTLTAVGGVVFWFCSTDRSSAVNRMATLNLLAATKFSALTVPLLYGPVLITGVDEHGALTGLSRKQFGLLKAGPSPSWWARLILQARQRCSQRRRRAAHRV